MPESTADGRDEYEMLESQLLHDAVFVKSIEKFQVLTTEDETLNAQTKATQQQFQQTIGHDDDDSDSESDSSDSSSDSGDSAPTVASQPLVKDYVQIEQLNENLQEAFKLSQKISREIERLHGNITRLYNVPFQKLSELVPDPILYARTIDIILDPTDPLTEELYTLHETHTDHELSSPNNSKRQFDNLTDTHQAQQSKQDRLYTVFNRNVSLTILLALKNDSNHTLVPRTTLTEIYNAAQRVIKLSQKQGILEAFIKSRAMRIAPNLTALLRIECSSRLLTQTQGLSQLVNMPAHNLISIGASANQSTAGFSKQYHQGILSSCDLVRDVGGNEKRRRRALRLVSSKAALCIRQDLMQHSPQGTYGVKMRVEIEKKLGIFQRPTQFGVRPLPRPDPIKKKRRGGRNARAWKARHGPTLLNQKQGMIKFGETEIIDDFTEESLGLLGQETRGVHVDRSQYKVVDRKLEYRLKQNTQMSSSDQAVAATLFGMSKEAPLPDDQDGHLVTLPGKTSSSNLPQSSSARTAAPAPATILDHGIKIEHSIPVKEELRHAQPTQMTDAPKNSRPLKGIDFDDGLDDDDDMMLPPPPTGLPGGPQKKKPRTKLFD